MVLVLGDRIESEAGIEVRPAEGGSLPLRDASVDAVFVIESFPELRPALRQALVRDAGRVLRPGGVFAAWTAQPDTALFGSRQGDHAVDFYVLEECLGEVFGQVRMLAQMPWQGFSLAPLLEAEEAAPRLRLEESLLGETAEASHYLALATEGELPAALIDACTMIPLPEAQVFGRQTPEELLDELEALREALSVRSARSVAAQSRSRELETQLESLRAQLADGAERAGDELREALEEARARADRAREAQAELRARLDELEAERSDLLDQLGRVRDESSAQRAELEKERAALAAVRDMGGRREESDRNDLAILTRTVSDQEKALARVAEQLAATRAQLEDGSARERELRGRVDSLESERQELQRQLDVRMAEGEGARKLAARVEAELEVLRNRHAEQGDRLSAKIEEASRLAGEVEHLRSRLTEQEGHLQQTRSRAEALSASAAEGAEKGRMLAELAADRERLREELGVRARQIESLEEKLWEGREALQRERLENVRLGGEVERVRDLLGRGREIEKQRASELESLGSELRAIELERVELKASLRAREERLTQLLSEADALAGRSVDAGELRGKLEAQRGELEALRAKLDKSEHLHLQTRELADQRGSELERAKEQNRQLQRRADESSDSVARLQTELDMRELEIQQHKATLERLGGEAEQSAEALAQLRRRLGEREGELERARARESELSRRVYELEDALDHVQVIDDGATPAVLELKKELEADAPPDGAFGKGPAKAPRRGLGEDPESVENLRSRLRAAQLELTRLREGARTDTDADSADAASSALRAQIRRLELENEVRASEQERMLLELDGAEQRIWEMTDASDRNAARFAASLAQLEKQKERVDQLLDELEVTRSLLAAEQARSLEQERLLASERAKLARAGLGSEGFPRDEEEDVDQVFADLNSGAKMLALGGPANARLPPPPGSGSTAFALDAELERLTGSSNTPARPAPSRGPEAGAPEVVDDRGATANHRGTPPPDPKRARVLIEQVDEDEWVDED